MSGSDHATNRQTLREWLLNERRFGILHIGRKLEARGSTKESARPATRPQSRASEPRRMAETAPVTAAFAPTRGRRSAIPTLDLDQAGMPAIVEEALSAKKAEAALQVLNDEHVRDCERCGLCQARTQTVFGVGRPRPELMFIGEGPGADEDASGEPFVGRAGQLLTKMIAAMGLERSQVYIANVVKCRPPGNRTPTDPEMWQCAPFLFRQIAILRPKLIITLGRPASQMILATKTPIGRLRGQFHAFPPEPYADPRLPQCRVMPTFHPAYLLRSPGEKGKTWSDLQQVMAEMGLK